VIIRGDRVVLRPFRSEELESWFAARLASADDPTVQPVGQPDRERLRERIDRSGDVQDASLDLAIEFEGRLVGEIGTYREPGRRKRSGLFFLSVGLFDPGDQGGGLGTEAVRLLCNWLFESAAANRIEGGTAVSNGAMRTVFERLGFEFEGDRQVDDEDFRCRPRIALRGGSETLNLEATLEVQAFRLCIRPKASKAP
jgi:RimJ/RimL family protein N-acetyltransferase